MRVLVHDFSGHPFQVQLSRSLARRDHEVLHVHCGSYVTGKGALGHANDDPATLEIASVDLEASWNRYSWAKRIKGELAYGAKFVRLASAFDPDVVLSSNDPLFAKARAARWCRRANVPWIFWLQDFYSVAMSEYASAKFGPAGRVIGHRFERLEKRLLREAAGVVAITDDFLPLLERWGVDPAATHVIENWAPLDEVKPTSRDNAWSTEHDLDGKRVVLYAGTLGLKHDPAHLLAAADAFADLDDVRIVVVSEGKGATWLAERLADRPRANLILLGYQPWDRMSEVLATGDVLTVLLEAGAGAYSVPSKVLSYLCAGRPIVGAIPTANLAARTLQRCGAGTVVAPGDHAGFVDALHAYVDDPAARALAGSSARGSAEALFDIATITDQFEAALIAAIATTGEKGRVWH